MQTNLPSDTRSKTKQASLGKTCQDSFFSNSSETTSLENSLQAIHKKKSDYTILGGHLEKPKDANSQENYLKCLEKERNSPFIESRTISMSGGPPKTPADPILRTNVSLCFVLTQFQQENIRNYLASKGIGDCYKLLVTRNIFSHKHMILIQLNSFMRLRKFQSACKQMIAHYSRQNYDIQFHEISQQMMLNNDHELKFASAIMSALDQTVIVKNNNMRFPNLIISASLTLLLKRLQYDIVPNPLNTDKLPQRDQVTEIFTTLETQKRLRSFEYDEIKEFISSEFDESSSIQMSILMNLTQKVTMIKMEFTQNFTLAEEWLRWKSVDI